MNKCNHSFVFDHGILVCSQCGTIVETVYDNGETICNHSTPKHEPKSIVHAKDTLHDLIQSGFISELLATESLNLYTDTLRVHRSCNYRALLCACIYQCAKVSKQREQREYTVKQVCSTMKIKARDLTKYMTRILTRQNNDSNQCNNVQNSLRIVITKLQSEIPGIIEPCTATMASLVLEIVRTIDTFRTKSTSLVCTLVLAYLATIRNDAALYSCVTDLSETCRQTIDANVRILCNYNEEILKTLMNQNLNLVKQFLYPV